RTARPSSSTVHAPHTPCSQPRCVPVSSSVWRRKSASVRRTGTSASRRAPFTVRLIARDALMRFLEGAPREHGGELPAIGGRDVHVFHAVQLAAGFARVAEQAGARGCAGQHLLNVACTHRG